jgi:hypothetical protein
VVKRVSTNIIAVASYAISISRSCYMRAWVLKLPTLLTMLHEFELLKRINTNSIKYLNFLKVIERLRSTHNLTSLNLQKGDWGVPTLLHHVINQRRQLCIARIQVQENM